MREHVGSTRLSAVLALMAAVAAHGAEWGQWRGPLATGVAPDADPAVTWSEGANVLWKAAIPGLGHSSPIISGNRVFLTSALETEKAADPERVKAVEAETPGFHRRGARLPKKSVQFTVVALDRANGSTLWRKQVHEQVPHAATHGDGSWASGSPVTDGARLYAYFGSYGLYAFDLAGNMLWSKQFGPLKIKANFGEGTSPVLCGDLLIVSQDQEGPSFVVAFDKQTGRERWRVDRGEATSWSTPLVVEHAGQRQVVVSATKRIRAYAPATGELLWEMGGMTGNVIPCPVSYRGLVICMSGFRGNALLAIRLGQAKGDVTEKPEAIAWSRGKSTPYVPSPLLYDGLLYYLKANNGSLTCADAVTGEEHYTGQDLGDIGRIYSSPVGAGGRVYVTGRDGLTVVIKHGKTFEVLSRNKLDDDFTASAAVAGNELYLRGYKSLYCILRKD